MAITSSDQIPGFVAGTWQIESSSSEVAFSLRHNTVGTVGGTFGELTGTIVTDEDYGRSSAIATIESASVSTGGATGDRHVRSRRFLDSEAFPELSFRSSAVHLNGSHLSVEGDVTIRGTTRPLTLDLTVLGFTNDPDGRTRARFTGTATVSRRAFGVRPRGPLRLADNALILGDKVSVDLKVQAILQTGGNSA